MQERRTIRYKASEIKHRAHQLLLEDANFGTTQVYYDGPSNYVGSAGVSHPVPAKAGLRRTMPLEDVVRHMVREDTGCWDEKDALPCERKIEVAAHIPSATMDYGEVIVTIWSTNA